MREYIKDIRAQMTPKEMLGYQIYKRTETVIFGHRQKGIPFVREMNKKRGEYYTSKKMHQWEFAELYYKM